MLKSPKSVVGQILKKTIALVMAYCFLATSSWSLNPSGSTLSMRTSPSGSALASLRSPLSALASASNKNSDLAGVNSQVKAAAKISANLSGLHAAMTAMQGPAVLAGDQTIESNIDSNSVGIAEAFPATATASGQVTSINVFLDAASASTQINIGIYADSGGHPSTLLTQGSSTQLYPGTWNTFNVTPVNLTSGTAYWITILGATGGVPMFRDRNVTGCHSLTSSQSTLTSLPSTWSTGQSWGTCFFSAYAVAGSSPATALIGDQAVEASLDKNPAGRAEAFPTLANATGTVGAIALYLDPTSGAGPVYTGLYADNSGHPGTLLGQGSTTQPVAGSWNQITITPSNITAGHKYWIAVLGTQATSPFFRDRLTSACSSETTPQSNLTSLPSTWTTGTIWSTCYISAYGLPGTATGPVLSISPATISLNATQPGPNPAPVNISITNTGTGTLSFTASTDVPWLSVSPANGTAPQTVQVSTSLGALAPGTYTGHVTITAAGAQGSPAVATATLTVVPDVPPSISASATPAANAAGWNNSNVTVSFVCAAGSYPLASCSPPSVVSTEGANQSVCGSAVDSAGISATACATVSLDKTAPTITGAVSPLPNAAGWNTSNVTVTYTCSDSLSGVVACPAPQVVSTEGKAQPISASVSDKAGNTATTSVSINIEKTAPNISASIVPAPNAAGWNNSNVSVNFVCAPSVSDIVSCQAPAALTTEGKGQTVTGNVTDQAGKSNTTVATVNIDETPPLISASAAPAPNAAGWNNTNVIISYLCSDSLSGIALCPSPATVSTEGAGQSIAAQATDQAGNTSAVTTTLNIDKTPPVVTVTVAPPLNAAGWSNTNETVSFTCTDSLSGVASCPPQQIVASEGQNQNISGIATDVAGNTTTGSVSLSIDKTPPTIVQLSTPDHVSALHGGLITVTVNDNFTLTQVVISVNGTALGTFTSAPYQANLVVPAGSVPGDTLTVTAVATDAAGNTQTASRGVSVTADGVVVGQVLSDATGLPVQGANVQLISTTGLSDQTDAKGRYSFQASDAHLFLSATNSGSTTVEREIFVQPGAGTVAIDARLTPLAAPSSIGSAGGTLSSGAISISVPPASVSDGTSFQLTPLSGQGLPGLLPLGWSPLAAFDLRASAVAQSLPATVSKLPGMVLHLATYSSALHAWVLVAANLQTVNGSCSFTVPGPGAYALVAADTANPPIPIPDPGDPLTGIPVQAIDPAASSNGSLNPPMLSPAGGTSIATLGMQSPSSAPSGTIVQANVSETFSLTTKEVVSEQTRTEDIILYNALAPANSTMGAQFPVTPSHQYTITQLVTGKVHLDILSGREGVRGQPGGNDPLTLNDGTTTLSVPGGALSQDTAISIQSISLEDFVPTSGSMSAVQEALVDFSGEILNTPAQLSISASGLNPSDTFLLAQVQRINGVPHMVAVALAQINGTSLSSVSSPGLPGVTQGGEYVFYDISAPVGFVQGITSSSAGPVPALVLTDSLQIAGISGGDGHYIVPVLAGTANLTATSPNTSLAGSATVQVTAGQTVAANILLAGVVTTATVSPADGSLGVPTSTIITITTSAPLNPQSIVQSNLSLITGPPSAPGAPVPLQSFILSTSGTTLTFSPVSNLAPATQYTIQVSGLADVSGGAVAVPTSSFTTKASAPLNFDPNAITFAFPDQNGNIHVSAPAGSLPPGSRILIVDQTNAVVFSLTALNDGSVSGDFPGTINDVLQVTVTDPNGATVTFTRSQFVAPDGSVAVGPGGGTVTGPGNTGLIIPLGALAKAATFKLTPLDQTAFPTLPTWPGLSFGSGLHVDAPDKPNFNQEVKLAFPVPANAPSNAFYYVYRRVTDQDGKTYFETVDHAFVQGTGASAQVVTASPPFCGYHNPIGNFNIVAAASGAAAFIPQFTPFQDFILMWDIAQSDPNQPGIASPGLIVGLVQQTVPAVVGQSAQTTQPYITNVKISLDSDPSQIAVYDPNCSTFTLFDPQLGGGSRTITATAPAVSPDGSTQGTTQLHAVVSEVNGIQVDDQTYGIFAGLEHQYRNIGRVTFTFPATTPPPPPPQLGIRVFTLDGNGHRQAAGGILQTGQNLVIAFQSKLPVQSASIAGSQFAVTSPDVAPEVTDKQPEALLLDARVVGTFPLGTAGTYTITATAIDPVSQTRVNASQSFLAVAPGGGNNQTLTCTAAQPPAPPTSGCSLPKVVDTAPVNNAVSVSPSVFPQITFNEPVLHVPGNVVLADHTGTSVPVQLIGIRPFDPNNPNANLVANPLNSADAITSLTIQPLFGLKYNETYTLTLNASATNGCVDSNNNPAPVALSSSLIIDQNQPPTGPLCLEPFPKPGDPQYKFTTFGPQEIGGTTDQFSSTRPVIIGNRAFLGERINVSLAGLGSVDITDPTNPIDKGISASFIGTAMDAAGQATSPVTGGPLVAIASAQPGIETIIPSNVWIYDVTNPDSPVRVAAVSATTSTTQDGELLRIFMKDQFLYASTFLKGLQVIDLQAAVSEYQSVFATNPTQFGQAITTEGNGFATDTVINTVPLFAKNYQDTPPVPDYQAIMYDLKAADYVTALPPAGSPAGTPGTTQTLMVATGRLPLVIADPQQTGSTAVLYPPAVGVASNGLPSLDPSPLNFQVQNPDGSTSTYTLQNGRALALGTISSTDAQGNSNSEQITVLLGSGNAPPLADGTAAQSVFAVVNMATNTSDPLHPITPVVQAVIGLPEFGTDVAIHGNLALIATEVNKILLVNLVDPSHPTLAGEIDAPPGSVFGDRLGVSDDGLIATSSFSFANGGLHLSSLGVVPRIAVDTTGLLATTDNKTSQDIPITYAINGDLSQVDSAQIQIKDDSGTVVFTTPVPVQASGSVIWPAGQPIQVTPNTISFQVQNPDGSSSMFAEASVEETTGPSPTPVILTATPFRIQVNSPQQMIDIKGRNYLPSTEAHIVAANAVPGTAATVLPIQFVSATEVKLTLTPDYFTQPGAWSLTLANASSESQPVVLSVITPNLPNAPTLTSINPAQLDSNDDPQDTLITLTGTNFVAGDTVVRAGFEDPQSPPELTAQVVSPTQINILIPAVWQAAPLQTTLHAESSQDSFLRSAEVGFEVLNTFNVQSSPLDPNGLNPLNTMVVTNLPNITTVADGYVPLAGSASAPPTAVTLQGSNFQTGASVVLDVDGVQTPLPAASSSPNQVEVQVPASLFDVKTYSFTLLLQVHNANPAQAHPQAQQQAATHQVYFGNQARYSGPPGGPANLYNLGGFHRRNTDIHAAGHPRDYFLMVPSAGFNDARAYTPANLLTGGANISFDPDQPSVVPNPPSTQQRVQPLRATGTLQQADGPINPPIKLNANKTVGAAKTLVGTLQLQEMRSRSVDVHLYFVTELAQPGAAQNPCTALPLAPARLKSAQTDPAGFVNRLQQGLNDIWTPQANVHFNVTISQGPAGTCQGAITPWPVHYDLNNDQALRQEPSVANGNPEIGAVLGQLPVPAPPAGVDRALNVYFVKRFLPSLDLNTTPPPVAFNNIPYNGLFGAEGGSKPYVWAVQGALPPGLAVHQNADGSFSLAGTPTQNGQFPLQVQVTDSENPVATASVNFTLTVIAPPQQNPPANVGNQLNHAFVTTLGFVTDIGASTIFMNDDTSSKILVHTLAHEIGHALFLTHTSESISQNPNLPTDCTFVPGLHIADSDFSDKSTLMWWLAVDGPNQGFNGIQSHIGVRHWIQLLNQQANNGCQQ